MPKKLLWIVNPHAGKAEIGQFGLGCVDIFVQAGYDVTVYTTQYVADAKRVARERAGEFDRIVCSGGDGTLGEVVSGLMEAGTRPELGYIPAGTTNDFAASMGLPRVPLQAAQIAAGESTLALDVGRFEDRYFTYVAAFGLFTDVSYTTPQNIKNWLGRAAYILEGIKSLSQVKNHRLHVETPTWSVDGDFILCMVTNSTSVGGFKGLPYTADVKMDDGQFEVLLMKSAASIIEVQETIHDLIQIGKTDSSLFIHFKTSSIKFESEEKIAWTLDGEFGGSLSKAEIEVIPNAITFIAPEKAAKPEKPQKSEKPAADAKSE